MTIVIPIVSAIIGAAVAIAAVRLKERADRRVNIHRQQSDLYPQLLALYWRLTTDMGRLTVNRDAEKQTALTDLIEATWAFSQLIGRISVITDPELLPFFQTNARFAAHVSLMARASGLETAWDQLHQDAVSLHESLLWVCRSEIGADRTGTGRPPLPTWSMEEGLKFA